MSKYTTRVHLKVQRYFPYGLRKPVCRTGCFTGTYRCNSGRVDVRTALTVHPIMLSRGVSLL